jgi:hypothetical protein
MGGNFFLEPATDVRVFVLSLNFEENVKEWLQHHTSLSAYNTLLQHKRQARLTQPLAKNS